MNSEEQNNDVVTFNDDEKKKDYGEDLIKNGKNAKLLLCKRCGSKILKPDMARYVEEEHFVPHMEKSGSKNGTEGEILPKFWLVDNIYTFENVGFCNTVGNTKYLTCADCEIGPIGLHDIPTKMSYVALDRVNHEDE